MAVRKTSLLVALCAAAIASAANLAAQSPLPDAQLRPPTQALPDQNRGGDNGDTTLEIAPRRAQPPLTEATPSAKPGDSATLNSSEQELPPVPTSGPPSSMVASDSPPQHPLPYLGISVQQVEAQSRRTRGSSGLEIVGVDPGSPAARAGLRGRGNMTTLGASGATAAALMAPLDIAVMPLLKKTGQLGQTGDLIVAIDDRRVVEEADLAIALGDSKPGDTLYLTIVRRTNDGTQRTLKIPVKLGNPAPNP